MLLAHMDKVYPEVPSHPRVSEQPGIAYPGLPTSSREALLLCSCSSGLETGFWLCKTQLAMFFVVWDPIGDILTMFFDLVRPWAKFCLVETQFSSKLGHADLGRRFLLVATSGD